MSAVGTMALHLRIAEFKFTHNFIICDQLPETELIFGIDMQRKILTIIHVRQRKRLLHTKGMKILSLHKNCDQKATIGTVKSMLRIPPQHNGVMPIKISGTIIEEHMAYFITDNNTSKGKDPNINIISSIRKIKGRTSFNLLVSNYTNKHLTFNKGEYVWHLEPADMDDTTIEQRETHQTNSVMLKKWWWRQSCLIFSTHHAMNYPILSNMNLIPYWRNMNPNLKGWNLNWNYTSHQHDDRHRGFQPQLSKTLPLCHEALPLGERGNRKTTHSHGHLQ